jgi:hypothetical protein
MQQMPARERGLSAFLDDGNHGTATAAMKPTIRMAMQILSAAVIRRTLARDGCRLLQQQQTRATAPSPSGNRIPKSE